MLKRTAEATWEGSLQDGNGNMKVGSGAVDVPFSFSSRFLSGSGTNPEELIGAAHAGCFSMALSKIIADNGYTPERIQTRAEVEMEKLASGYAVNRITLFTEAKVPNLEEDDFQTMASQAKVGCPISKLLTGTVIDLKSTLAT